MSDSKKPQITVNHLSIFKTWYNQCVPLLADMEKESLETRTKISLEIASKIATNEPQYIKVPNRSNLQSIEHPSKYFKATLDENIENNLSFIKYWKGLQINKLLTLPNSFNDYKKRSINWLQGRRSQNYAYYFFPKLITCVLNYFEKICNVLFVDNSQLNKLFLKLLIYKFLSIWLAEHIDVKYKKGTTLLVCEKSIKIKTTGLNLILQNIILDNWLNTENVLKKLKNKSEIKNIDKCFKNSSSAINYFENLYQSTLKLVKKLLNGENIIKEKENNIDIDTDNINNNNNNNNIEFKENNLLNFNDNNLFCEIPKIPINNINNNNNNNQFINIEKYKYIALKNEIKELNDIIMSQNNKINTLVNELNVYRNKFGYLNNNNNYNNVINTFNNNTFQYINNNNNHNNNNTCINDNILNNNDMYYNNNNNNNNFNMDEFNNNDNNNKYEYGSHRTMIEPNYNYSMDEMYDYDTCLKTTNLEEIHPNPFKPI